MSDVIRAIGYDVLPPTGMPTAADGAATGNMVAGSYRYRVSYVTQFGETTAGPISASVVTTTGSVDLTAIPTSTLDHLIARKIYRTAVGNVLPYKLVATINDLTTLTYTDIKIDAALGADEPAINNAHSTEQLHGWTRFSKPLLRSVDFTIVGTGGTQATANPIPESVDLAFVDPIAGGQGVRLPPIRTELVGMVVTVRNTNAAQTLEIYPFETNVQIDANGVGNPITLAVAPAAQNFIVRDQFTWFTF